MQQDNEKAYSERKIFPPGKDFYSEWVPSEQRLNRMAKEIMQWSRVKPENIVCCYDVNLTSPGEYSNIQGRRTIRIKKSFCQEPYKTAAILAHEITHYYMDVHGLNISDKLENEHKTEMMSVSIGLGILVINGMSYRSNWILAAFMAIFGILYVKEEKRWFGYYNYAEYCNLFLRDIKNKQIPIKEIRKFIHPTAMILLDENYRQRRIAKFIIAAILAGSAYYVFLSLQGGFELELFLGFLAPLFLIVGAIVIMLVMDTRKKQ